MEKEGMILGNKACPYEGEYYAHGKELTIDGVGMVCLNGRWEASIEDRYPTSEHPPGTQ